MLPHLMFLQVAENATPTPHSSFILPQPCTEYQVVFVARDKKVNEGRDDQKASKQNSKKKGVFIVFIGPKKVVPPDMHPSVET